MIVNGPGQKEYRKPKVDSDCRFDSGVVMSKPIKGGGFAWPFLDTKAHRVWQNDTGISSASLS
jgi:hypothetical protein